MRASAIVLGVLALAASAPAADADLPRRMLVVQVHHYLYLSPLTTPPAANNREAIDRLAASLHVPTWLTNNQLFVLSEDVLAPENRLPTRGAIAAGLRGFCDTSRPQDRILIYFRGHAIEKGGKAYFAPVEAEPDDVATLIPVADVYEMLKACKATQKVVVWDVCPRNPNLWSLRPGMPAMSPELFVALLSVPTGSGVQAVTPCLPGEFSLEYLTPRGEAGSLPGSVLFDALRKAIDGVDGDKRADPAYPIPIIDAFPALEKYVASAATALNARQTPKLHGNLSPALAPVSPNESFPGGVHFPIPRYTAANDARAILQELKLPPIFVGEAVDPLPLLPYDSALLKPYLPDVPLEDIPKDADKYPLRLAVLHALQTLRDAAEPLIGKAITTVKSPVNDAYKNTIKTAQDPLAVATSNLELELKALEEARKYRDKETRRWQAHYDYVLGQVQLRLAAMNEYNMALGNIRTEQLPELPEGATGWRLRASDSMLNRKDVQELAEAARKTLREAAAANKGTPWEVLAKKALSTPTGLKWEPMR